MAERFAVTVPEGLSLTSESVKLVNWLKQVGDEVRRGEALCEVETEKATLEVEALEPGVLVEITVPVGTDTSIGNTIAWMEART
jgi:pyruvate/2-oxoglutarate dehydrogenase complex dihydrolipoamide acyltransferase (E2) component